MFWFGLSPADRAWDVGNGDGWLASRRTALDLVSRCMLADNEVAARFWEAKARAGRGDGSDDVELGGEA